MDYVTDTSPFLPQNKKRKKCVHKNNYIISDMKCILPSWIAFDRLRCSSHSISQHFQKLFLLKESCGVMYFIFVALYCLLPFSYSSRANPATPATMIRRMELGTGYSDERCCESSHHRNINSSSSKFVMKGPRCLVKVKMT